MFKYNINRTVGINLLWTAKSILRSGYSVACVSSAWMPDGTLRLECQGHRGRPAMQPLSGPPPPPTARKGFPTALPPREACAPKPPPHAFARATTFYKPRRQQVRGRGSRAKTRTSPDRRLQLCQTPAGYWLSTEPPPEGLLPRPQTSGTLSTGWALRLPPFHPRP